MVKICADVMFCVARCSVIVYCTSSEDERLETTVSHLKI